MYSIHATCNATLKGFSKQEHETLRSPATHGTITHALIVGKSGKSCDFPHGK